MLLKRTTEHVLVTALLVISWVLLDKFGHRPPGRSQALLEAGYYLVVVEYFLERLRGVLRVLQSKELRPVVKALVLLVLIGLGMLLFAFGFLFALFAFAVLLLWRSIKSPSKWFNWLAALVLAAPVIVGRSTGRVRLELPFLDVYTRESKAIWMLVPPLTTAGVVLACASLLAVMAQRAGTHAAAENS